MAREEISTEVESVALEMIALRERMIELSRRCHAQGGGPVGTVKDEHAWAAYLALRVATPSLYSRGHPLKRFARALRNGGSA